MYGGSSVAASGDQPAAATEDPPYRCGYHLITPLTAGGDGEPALQMWVSSCHRMLGV